MVDAIVSYAIDNLTDFITQKFNIRLGVNDAVVWLKDELGYLLISVRAAELKKESLSVIEKGKILLWINSVKDVANDAVTLLDRFSLLHKESLSVAVTDAAPKQGVMDCLWSIICVCTKEGNLYDTGKEKFKKEANLFDIGNQIESLKERVVLIKNRRDEYGIDNILATPVVQQRKRTLLRAASFQNKVDVVGFEDDFKTLLAELVREDPSLGLISIYGMGGLGKSTLAGKLYHSSELSHFKSRAWVCVSEDYDIIHVLKKIIKSFMGHEPDALAKMDEVDLLRHLQKLLQDGDRYLVVIDDIWDIKVWKKIKEAFPDKKNGSRIILTSRNKEVAEEVDDKCFVHELRFLREDESWQLFCKGAKPTRNLEKLGKEMVDKCGGLPLAIVVLSGLLLHKRYDDWSKVKAHLWKNLEGKSTEIKEILSLSYDDLSFQIRQCLLYLARFPEDDIFDVKDLMRLWIAEEFISEADEGDGVVMEDVADQYLNELVNRNMIQIASLEWSGDISEGQVHDLVRDLVIQKATEGKLMGIFKSSKQHPSPISLLEGQPRHAITNGIGEYLKLIGSSSHNFKLRSLAVYDEMCILVGLEEMKLMCTKFKYLNVLDMRDLEAEEIPEEIGDLVLLKFLGLMSGIDDKTLVIPPSIGKLKKLQTLCSLGYCDYEFPQEMCELKELRHLEFEDTSGSLNISSHQTKLQTLNRISYSKWIHIDTVNFTNLHTLNIIDDDDTSIEEKVYSLESIANLTSLQSFIIRIDTCFIPTIKPLSSCKRLKNVCLWGKMKDPSELRFLPDSVTSLELVGSEFTQDPMPALGSLSNLTSLIVYRIYMGEIMVCNHDAFPSLQFLKLNVLSNLEEWQVEDGALPSLQGLDIVKCEKLEIVPERLKHVPSIPDIYDV